MLLSVLNTLFTFGSAISMSQEKNYNFFLDNLEKFREQHSGMYVLIKDEKICGVYNSALAVEANARKYGNPLIIFVGADDFNEYILKDK